MNKAVFLDRDGTIIEDVGYLSNPQQIEFIPQSIEAIKLLNEAGYKVIVVTNQAGVARGYFTEDMLQTIDKTLQKQILRKGAYVDRIYYCPHHADHGIYPYNRECDCRKPNPGMLKKAAKDFDIDLSQSFMIGDKASDIGAGQNAGTKTILVLSGRGEVEQERMTGKETHIARNLLEAVNWLLKAR